MEKQLTTKVCTKCKQIKSVFNFSGSKVAKDSLASWCKSCVGEKSSEYYQKNKLNVLEKQKIKRVILAESKKSIKANKKGILGIGYIGVGNYKRQINGVFTKSFIVWRGMLERCYSEKYHIIKPSYIGCSVDKHWHNFQNFAKWFEENYIEGFHLDKDILVEGNKIYSPETCCFVPSEINTLFTKRQNNRGEYPIGVTLRNNTYIAKVNMGKIRNYLGTFDTPEKAFQAYKMAKEQHIKEVADKWRGKITEKVYNTLINYKIEIDD